MTAGDGDRAAFFFLGTTTPGSAGTGTDQTSPYFNGVWNGYIATTYDCGRTWVTVNATPNDPIQRGVICTNGTTCPTGTRNLLDFNDLEVDKQGRAVAVAADGCITAGCISGLDKNNDGQFNTRFDNDGARRALIIRQASGLGLFKANDPPPPTGGGSIQVIEDNSPHVEYSNGWHRLNDNNASDNHFRLNNGQSPNFFARLLFNTTGQNGSVTYHYAKSPRGGTAQVFVDGVSKGLINYNGTQGSQNAPQFGFSVTYNGLSAGSHTLELRNISGTVYVDKFTINNGSSTATPATGPGTTTSSTNLVGLGQDIVKNVTVDSATSEIAVMAVSNLDAPFRLILIDPSGAIVQSVEAANGIAVIEKPVTQTGTYLVKVVNLSVGPIQVFSATTPYVAR